MYAANESSRRISRLCPLIEECMLLASRANKQDLMFSKLSSIEQRLAKCGVNCGSSLHGSNPTCGVMTL
jgi:hypothetical protein